MTATRCPPREELEGLLDERLDPADLRRVSEHVSGCPDCQKALDTLTAAADSGLASWRGLASGDSAPPHPEFLDRIKQLPAGRPAARRGRRPDGGRLGPARARRRRGGRPADADRL